MVGGKCLFFFTDGHQMGSSSFRVTVHACVFLISKASPGGLAWVVYSGPAVGRGEYQKAVGERHCSTFITAQFAEGVSQSAISPGE